MLFLVAEKSAQGAEKFIRDAERLLLKFFQDLSGGRGQSGAAQPLGQSSRVLAAQDPGRPWKLG
jgi:hypothetical protein